VPGMQGAYGQPIPMIAPYSAMPPAGAQLAQAMMANSVPLAMVRPGSSPMPASDLMLAGGRSMPGEGSGIQLASAQGMPGEGFMQAGLAPPGVTTPQTMAPPGVPADPSGIVQTGCSYPPNAVAAYGAITGPGCGPRWPTRRTSVRFVGPNGMKISWPGPFGETRPTAGANQIEAPGRYNFLQGAIYRLKLTDLPNRPGVDLYPTLEVVPANLKTDAYLAHSSVPVFFTDEDFDQVANGNFLVKVIYLPYPQYADLATTGPDEIVSTRLEPGVDPIAEACKRGSILLIIRLGNIDLEAPNTPPMQAPAQFGPGGPGCMAPGMPNMMVPASAGMGIGIAKGNMTMPAPLPGEAPVPPVSQKSALVPAGGTAPTPASLASQGR